MGVWKRAWTRARRPKVIGMYIEGGVLYTHKSMRDPDFMLTQTPQEQAEYLKPVPHSLMGARCKFEVHKGGPSMAVGVAVGPVLPIIPVGVKKAFLVTVVLADGGQLAGWTPNGKAALRFYKAVNRAARQISASGPATRAGESA